MSITLEIRYQNIIDVEIVHKFSDKELQEFKEHYELNDEQWKAFLEDPDQAREYLYDFFMPLREPNEYYEYEGDRINYSYKSFNTNKR